MVVTSIERPRRDGSVAPLRRRLDLHAWVAIGAATLIASGILALSAIAYAHVP